ncbi:unnamed protein product [Closterium sp. NIES-53]
MFKGLRTQRTKEKFEFRFRFHATRVPLTGFEQLVVSLVPTDTNRSDVRTDSATVRNGICRWTETVTEVVKFTRNPKTRTFEAKAYRFAVSSAAGAVLGEASLNLTEFIGYSQLDQRALPLRSCPSGSVLHVTVQCFPMDPRDGDDSADSVADTHATPATASSAAAGATAAGGVGGEGMKKRSGEKEGSAPVTSSASAAAAATIANAAGGSGAGIGETEKGTSGDAPAAVNKPGAEDAAAVAVGRGGAVSAVAVASAIGGGGGADGSGGVVMLRSTVRFLWICADSFCC